MMSNDTTASAADSQTHIIFVELLHDDHKLIHNPHLLM